jgi:hypothetical protein
MVRMTGYVILEGDTNGNWTDIGIKSAHTPRQAIQAYLLEHLEEPRAAAYVAVPTRNWRPVPVRVESRPRVLFGQEQK